MSNDLIRVNLKVRKDVDPWLYDFLHAVPCPRKRCEELRHILKIGLSVHSNVVTSMTHESNNSPVNNDKTKISKGTINSSTLNVEANEVSNKVMLELPTQGLGGLLD